MHRSCSADCCSPWSPCARSWHHDPAACLVSVDRSEEVPAALDGQRIDRVVAMLSGMSRTEAAELVRSGGVALDGQVATRGADRLTAGTVITIAVPDATGPDLPAPEAGIEVPVVHVDAAVI